MQSHPFIKACTVLALLLSILLTGCATQSSGSIQAMGESDGPANQGTSAPRQDGNANAGRDVFRFETFGNEGFWTDAARLPAGMMAAKVTPLQALQLGLSVDVDALDPGTQKELMKQLKEDPSGKRSALLNDPAVTGKLIAGNAVIGFVPKGEKVGASCALCHTITDGAVFNLPNGGSIGHRQDGLTNHNLNVGKLLATAANSRALYPLLQLVLKANGGKTLGRAPQGLTENSTETEVDAYLSNPKYYPVGMFDDSPDGNGDPMHITPLFRQDLAAPFGSEGSIGRLDNFSNLVYTALLDPTNLTSPGGRAFLHKLGGAAGDEIADTYVKVLTATNVTGYPYVKATPHPKPGTEDAPVGLRVDNTKLLDLNAYLASIPAPAGASVDAKAASHGRELFRTTGCTSCHNVDQSKPVPANIIPMKTIFPGDNPTVLAQREPPLNPVMDTPGVFFDDKMAVVNASMRGEQRGIALPLLLGLTRKPVFLHDDSVASLDQLLDPKRGAKAPHPFYLADPKHRKDMVEFLRGLDTSPLRR
jgi:mono/diheme cytochrome c family protein